MKKIPRKLQSVLWSYDIRRLNPGKDKELIIQQVLNYGDWEDLKWLYRNYSENKIKEVVRHPRRGIWFEQVLNFWCLMLKIRLPKKVRERAIFHPIPMPSTW